ncbi:YfjI family protein [Micromonospora maritima]|uniref:YfjI family protein n=1 Tax=Micromonospora maritima TaxID=986711 RepID=UPI00157D186F|nr:YfjI family protein [Micromonospora maritima]
MTESFLAKAKAAREQRERPLRAVPDQPTGDAFDAPIPVGTGGGAGYAQTALTNEIDRVRTAVKGTRNDALNRAAFSLGQLVAGGELTETEVRDALTDAARAAGLDDRETAATIASGLGKGQLNPRQAPRVQILRGIYSSVEQATERFEDPEPLEGVLEPAPPFPVDALPAGVGEFVHALSATTQTPPDLAAMMSMSALSVAAANRCWVSGGGSWVEALILWTITALPPASRKSPVVGAIAEPFHRLELEALTEHQQSHGAKADLLEAAESRRSTLVGKLGKVESAVERAKLEAELDAVRGEIADLTVAPPREYLVNDFTPEALALVLNENGGTIGVLDDEGGVFGAITGRYTNGTPQLDLVLTAYDGKKPYKQSRVGRRKVHIPWPAVAIGLAVQPSVLRDTTQTPVLRDRGLMGRFAYCVPHDTVGTRDNRNVPDMPAHLVGQWDKTIEAITRIPLCGPDQPKRIIQLAADAYEAHLDYRDMIEPRLHQETGDLAFMSDWAGKHAGRVLRIAGLFHLAAGNDPAHPIDFHTMAAAIDVADWMLEHAVRVYGGWRAAAGGRDMTGPLAVLRWIRRDGVDQFTHRDAHQALRGQGWANADAVRDALVVLVEMGWLSSVERLYADGKRRNPGGLFVAHPTLTESAR